MMTKIQKRRQGLERAQEIDVEGMRQGSEREIERFRVRLGYESMTKISSKILQRFFLEPP